MNQQRKSDNLKGDTEKFGQKWEERVQTYGKFMIINSFTLINSYIIFKNKFNSEVIKNNFWEIMGNNNLAGVKIPKVAFAKLKTLFKNSIPNPIIAKINNMEGNEQVWLKNLKEKRNELHSKINQINRNRGYNSSFASPQRSNEQKIWWTSKELAYRGKDVTKRCYENYPNAAERPDDYNPLYTSFPKHKVNDSLSKTSI